MPDHMQKIMADYDRRRHLEEAQQSFGSRMLGTTAGGLLGAAFAGAVMYMFYCFDDVSSGLHELWGVIFRRVGPEASARLMMWAARWRVLPKDFDKDDPYLIVEPQEGLKFFTPVGLASGFDTEGTGLSAFFDLGFGFVDVGPVCTAGSVGLDVWKNLIARDTSREVTQFGLTGVCVGGDQEQLLGHLSALGSRVQLFSVDLSLVPPELCSNSAALAKFTRALTVAAAEIPGGGPRVFLRLPAAWPSAAASQEARRAAAADVAEAALAGGASGIVLSHDDAAADGDCRGSDDSRRAHREIVAEAFLRTKGELVLVASGGLRHGRDAMDAVEAGATVVQISSMMLFEGPAACRRIKNEMSQLLMQEGHVNLQSMVGAATLRKSGRTKQKKRNPWKAKASPV